MTNKIDSLSSAASTLASGLARDEGRVAKTAEALTTVDQERELAIAAARRESAAAITPVVDRPVIVAGGDIISPLVSLLQAKTSYTAEVKAIKVTSDLQRETVDRLGRKSVEG